MTETETGQAAAQSANGTAPLPEGAAVLPGVPAGDRAMGIVGILFGLVIVAVGADLVSGGAVSAWVSGLTGREDGG